MELDLNRRNSRWKQEEQKRKERAKQKLELERKKREEAAKAQREMELIQSQKRQERLAELAALEAKRLEEERVTGGIKYVQRLNPVPTSNDGDKIILPASALQELDPQGALDLGVFTFELVLGDHKTHAGVLEFTAEEGTVGLPPKVARSLFQQPTQQPPRELQVRFIRLEKGRFASLQPKGKGFGSREMDFKRVLERSLKVHTTLTVGDVLFVRHGNQTFEVVVKQLKPEPAVSILNTDLEVDLLPCEEVTRAQELEKRREELKHLEEEKQNAKRQWQQSKLQSLVAEPDERVGIREQVKIMVRLASGTQATRRFLHDQLLAEVMEWVEALVGEEKQSFQLVATFPRRVFGTEAAAKTLRELGLATRQENLFVEMKQQAQVEHQSNETLVVTEEEVIELPPEWQQARQQLEKTIDEQLQTSQNNLPGIHALEPVMPVNASAPDQLTKWDAQLKELETMGFTDRLLNVQLLERYQGRLLRVVNFLSEL